MTQPSEFGLKAYRSLVAYFQQQIMDILGGPSGKRIRFREVGIMAVELEIPDSLVPPEATELRYHSSDLVAFATSLA